MKENLDDTNRWKYIPCSWIGRINIFKMTILPKSRNRVNAIPDTVSKIFFHRTRTKYFKFSMEMQKTLEGLSGFEKRKKKLKKKELEESRILTSKYTTKLQSSRECGTGTNTDTGNGHYDTNSLPLTK